MVTFSGTEYVMPRSWHSSTSYLSFKPTESPQVSQTVPRFSFALPQEGQGISRSPMGLVRMVAPQPVHLRRRCCRPSSFPHLHSQTPIAYSTNWSSQFSRKSVMGKIDLKTA